MMYARTSPFLLPLPFCLRALLTSRYTALLYGHEKDARRDMSFIPLDGTLFDNVQTQVWFAP